MPPPRPPPLLTAVCWLALAVGWLLLVGWVGSVGLLVGQGILALWSLH